MTAKECITGRRSIRRFKPDAVSHELIAQIVETASFAPSWKNTQIARYTVIEGDLKNKIAAEATTPFPGNGKIIENAPALVVVSVIKNRCGYERDGSFTTPRKDTWQMFDAGVAAHHRGLGVLLAHDAWRRRGAAVPATSRLFACDHKRCAQCHGAGILFAKRGTGMPGHLRLVFQEGHSAGFLGV